MLKIKCIKNIELTHGDMANLTVGKIYEWESTDFPEGRIIDDKDNFHYFNWFGMGDLKDFDTREFFELVDTSVHVGNLGDVDVYKDDNSIYIKVDGKTKLSFTDIDNVQELIELLTKALK